MSQKSGNKSNKQSQNKQAIDSMKYEIAREFGVNLGPDSSSRSNGTVGGEITKRLVERGKSSRGGYSKNNK